MLNSQNTVKEEHTTGNTGIHPIQRIVFVLLFSVFLGELLAMQLIKIIPIRLAWLKSPLDALILTILILPAVYLFVLQPFSRQSIKRKILETEFKNSLALLQATFESIHNGILVVNNQGGVLSTNAKFAELWRIPEEIINTGDDNTLLKSIVEQLDDSDGFLSLVKELYEKPEATSYDLINFKDGRIFERISKPMYIEGKSKGRVWSFHDITERMQVEETLKNEKLFIRTIIDNIPDSIYAKDLACRKTLANLTDLRHIGVKSESEVLGKDDFEFFPKELAEKFHADDNTVITTGKPVINREEFIYDEKGQKVWLLSSKLPIFDKNHQITGLVGIGRDITARKQAEDSLKAMHTRQEAILATIPDIIMEVNIDLKYVWANKAGIEFFGDEVLGKEARYYFEGKQETYDIVNPLFTGDENIVYVESWQRRKDNQRRLLAWWCCAFKDENGKIIGTLSTARDITEQKLAEAAQEQSEERYRVLFENMGEGAGYLDELEIFVLANPAAEKIFGVGKGELTGLCMYDFLSSANIERIENQTQGRIRGESGVYELEITLKDGTKKDILVTATPYFENNKFIGAFGIFQDITENKRAQLALKESEELYRNLVEKIPDGVYKSTEEGKFIDVNPAMVSMLGYSNKDELMAIDIKTQLYFKIADRENAELHEKLEKIGVFRMKKKNGSEILVEDHGWLNFDEESGILYHEGIMRDVTERKQAELALQESELLYRNLVERIPDGVYKSTHNGKFVDVNPAMVKMLGYETKEELLAIDIKTQLYFDITDRESLVLQEKMEEMGIFSLKKKDGTGIWVEDHGWYNLDENGVIVFHEGILRDITERRQSEEEIKQKNEELTKLIFEKDRFFSIIAHDLRSPFNSFLGLTQIMADELPSLSDTDIQKIAVNMKNSASNLFRLLENLLNWSRMQQGLIPFNPEALQLYPVVQESFVLLSDTARKKDIDLSYSIPDSCEIYADSNMLETVIRNILSNAIKFTPKGGKIILLAKVDDDKSVTISTKDSGIGMSPDMVNNLFQLADQTNRRGTENEPSSGLGLLLCKEFVERHGGELWVESEEGKGSLFSFTIPGNNTPKRKSDIDRVVSAENKTDYIKNLKILIAEDNKNSELLLRIAISPFSKQMLEASTGFEVIDVLRNNPDIDLIMMDINMPGLDGLEATRRIRQFNKDVVIIAQTAFGQSDSRAKAMKAGCNDYISKPIEINQLLELIKTNFGSQ